MSATPGEEPGPYLVGRLTAVCGTEEVLAYWRRLLTSLPLEISLPADRPHPPQPLLERDTCAPADVPDASDAVRLAAFVALLHRYTGATDLTVGHDGLPLRVSVEHEPTFAELVRRVTQAHEEAETHRVPVGLLVEELRPRPTRGGGLFFNTAFATAARPAGELPAPVDVLLEVGDGSARASYHPGVFDGTTIERLLGHYRTLLADALARPETPVADLELMSPRSTARSSTSGTTPRTRCRRDTWPAMFAEQVRQRPDAVALVFEDDRPHLRRAGRARQPAGARADRAGRRARARRRAGPAPLRRADRRGGGRPEVGRRLPADRPPTTRPTASRTCWPTRAPVCLVTTAETARDLPDRCDGHGRSLVLDAPATAAELAGRPAHDPDRGGPGAPLTVAERRLRDLHLGFDRPPQGCRPRPRAAWRSWWPRRASGSASARTAGCCSSPRRASTSPSGTCASACSPAAGSSSSRPSAGARRAARRLRARARHHLHDPAARAARRHARRRRPPAGRHAAGGHRARLARAGRRGTRAAG